MCDNCKSTDINQTESINDLSKLLISYSGANEKKKLKLVKKFLNKNKNNKRSGEASCSIKKLQQQIYDLVELIKKIICLVQETKDDENKKPKGKECCLSILSSIEFQKEQMNYLFKQIHEITAIIEKISRSNLTDPIKAQLIMPYQLFLVDEVASLNKFQIQYNEILTSKICAC